RRHGRGGAARGGRRAPHRPRHQPVLGGGRGPHRRPPHARHRAGPRLQLRRQRDPPRRPGAAAVLTGARPGTAGTAFLPHPGPGRTDIRTQALQAREAALAIAQLSTEAKDALLRAMADALEADAAPILEANGRDIAAAAAKGVGSAMQDRLRLDEKRLKGVADALREVAGLPDPVAQVTRAYDRPNGIHVERVRVPLGVIAMIYEARPNVTADAAALCLKAGNAVILRGGSEAIHSNTAIAASLKRALREAGLPEAV